MTLSQSKQHPVVLFDGVCNLCQGSVQFIIRRDPRAYFRFASLQSAYGSQLLREAGLDDRAMESIVLVTDHGIYQRSTAALEIARHLSGLWPVLYLFKIIPQGLRDVVYDWIARNRYRWFGKTEACWIPTPDLQSRFADIGS
ncbi:MAG: thiol-disulfide oxidoreductase DCC family protein [Cyclobacteriaceae bacterium]|nr:thiol-disulfide oxidoreductase DCC family protein [Cyclobacteriaceae bacterium]